MSVLRYSGEIRIRVTYLESRGEMYRDGTPRHPNGSYRCFLRSVKGAKATIIVGAPAILSHGVDSPEAFDEAASAAIAFAVDEADTARREGNDYTSWGDVAAFNDSGWYVGRSIAAAWPSE